MHSESEAEVGDEDDHERLLLAAILGRNENQYFSTLGSAISQSAAERNAAVVFFHVEPNGPSASRLVEICADLGVDGILGYRSRRLGSAIDDAIDRLPPVVSLGDTTSPEVTVYEPELTGVGAAVARHFAESGRRRLAFIGNEREQGRLGRMKGYLDEAAALGLRVGPDYTVFGSPTRDHGLLLVHELLGRDGERPDAIFCYNDHLALGALAGLAQLGIAVPDEIAVVGCDNIAESAIVDPPLTTVSLGAREVGTAITNLLIDRIRNGDPPSHRVAQTHALLVRESSNVHIAKHRATSRQAGWLVSGLAHDLNNTLALIGVRLDLANSAAETLDSDMDIHLRQIGAAVNRMAGLVDQLTVRTGKVNYESASVASVAEQVVDEVDHQTAAELVIGAIDRLLWVAFSGRMLVNVLHNLILNADRSGATRIELRAGRVTSAATALPVQSVDYVFIDVVDNGPGIPAEDRSHIFEPLVTRSEGGTGLGLAMAKSLLQAAGGKIVLQPTATGTCFTLYLREAKQPGEPRPKA